MLIHIRKRQGVSIPELQLNRLRRGGGCRQKRGEEKILKRAEGREVTMKRCKRVGVHAKDRDSMLIDVRLQKIFAPAICLGLAFSFGACDRMITRHAQVIKDAESNPRTANSSVRSRFMKAPSRLNQIRRHPLRLALLYDDRCMIAQRSSPFKRYLRGAHRPHANEVKNSMKRTSSNLGRTCPAIPW